MGCSGRTGFGSRKFGLHECSRLKGIWVARLRVLYLGSGAEVIGFIPSLAAGVSQNHGWCSIEKKNSQDCCL